MRYHSATSFEEAASIAANAGGITRFLAGGTDVLVQLRSGLVTPDDLIDLKQIPGVHDIEQTNDRRGRLGCRARRSCGAEG
jgi:xanthine dehydrogenase FAD-binding subunit